MPTRDEHVAAAEAIARDNPEWIPFRHSLALQHKDGRAWVRWSRGDSWHAFPSPGKQSPLRTRDGCATRSFRSPATAIRALGFSLATESTDA
jgi:hypothetical protein